MAFNASKLLRGVESVKSGEAFKMLRLEDISPDPNQPRLNKREKDIAELGESIRAAGKVLQALTVVPLGNGKYQIGDGELRWRACQWANANGGRLADGSLIEEVPASIVPEFSDYDQVRANIHRFEMQPLDLALFIQKKLKEGGSQVEVARQMAVPRVSITEYLALIDMPPWLQAVYGALDSPSPKTLYELRRLAKSYPDAVEAWATHKLSSGAVAEITRTTVAGLGQRLKSPPLNEPSPGEEAVSGTSNEAPPDALPLDVQTPGGGRPTEHPAESGNKPPSSSESKTMPTPAASTPAASTPVVEDEEAQSNSAPLTQAEEGAAIRKSGQGTTQAPTGMRVLHGGRPATIIRVSIRYEDGSTADVAAESLQFQGS